MKYYCWFAFAFFIIAGFYYSPLSAKSRPPAPDSTRQQKSIDSINAAALKIYVINPPKARKLAQEALLLSKKQGYAFGIGNSFENIGKSYWAQGYYPISLFYYNTALQYLKRTPEKLLLSDCYRCLGRNYTDLKKYKQGLVFLQTALKLANTSKLQRELALTERSYTYMALKRNDESIADIREALALCRILEADGSIAILYSRLCSVYLAEEQLDKAAAYSDTTYRMSIAVHNKRLRSTVLMSKAFIAFQQKKYQQSIGFAESAAQLADSIGNMEVYSNASRMLYRVYKASGNKDKAQQYQDRYVALQDSLNRTDKQNSMQLIEDYFSLNTRLHDIEEIERKNEVNKVLIRSQGITIASLTATVLLLFVAMYISNNYYQQKNKLSKQLEARHQEAIEKNKLIAKQAENLNELNQQKDRLLAIIGHDLKSPLNNVSSIVELFGSGDMSAAEVQSLMLAMDPVIKGAELTLASLVEWAGSQVRGNQVNTTTVDLFVTAMEIGGVYKHAFTKKGISFHVELPADLKAIADENHLKMVLRNLISNAIKFTGEKGSVTVSAKPQEGTDSILIEVADTGKGMTMDEVANLFSANTHFSKTGTSGEKGAGIGLLLCRQLVELNGGEIGVTSVRGQGSVFYFTLQSTVGKSEESRTRSQDKKVLS